MGEQDAKRYFEASHASFVVGAVASAVSAPDLPITAIRDKLERAARNRERLHLNPEQVRELIRSPVYARIQELSAAEFARWLEKVEPVAGPSQPDDSGSNPPRPRPSGPIIGGEFAVAGSIVQAEAVERAERRRATAAVAAALRRKPTDESSASRD